MLRLKRTSMHKVILLLRDTSETYVTRVTDLLAFNRIGFVGCLLHLFVIHGNVLAAGIIVMKQDVKGDGPLATKFYAIEIFLFLCR